MQPTSEASPVANLSLPPSRSPFRSKQVMSLWYDEMRKDIVADHRTDDQDLVVHPIART